MDSLEDSVGERIVQLGSILHNKKIVWSPNGNYSVEYSHCPPSEDYGWINEHVFPKEERREAEIKLRDIYLESDKNMREKIKQQLKYNSMELFELVHPIASKAFYLSVFFGIASSIYIIGRLFEIE
jgi:hypothetical protein